MNTRNLVLALIVVVLALTMCACGGDQTGKAIQTVAIGTNPASDSFSAFWEFACDNGATSDACKGGTISQ